MTIDNSNAAEKRKEFRGLNCYYNHYDLLFSHKKIIVIISDEDVLLYKTNTIGFILD